MQRFEVEPGPQSRKAILLAEDATLTEGSLSLARVEDRIRELEKERVRVLRQLERQVGTRVVGLLEVGQVSSSLLETVRKARARVAETTAAVRAEGLQEQLNQIMILYNYQLRRERVQAVVEYLETLLRYAHLSSDLPQEELLASLASLRSNRGICDQFSALSDVRRAAEAKVTACRSHLFSELATTLDTSKIPRTEDALGHYETTLRSISILPGEGLTFPKRFVAVVAELCGSKVRCAESPTTLVSAARVFESLAGVVGRVTHVCAWQMYYAKGEEYLKISKRRARSRIQQHDESVFRQFVERVSEDFALLRPQLWSPVSVGLAEFLSNADFSRWGFEDFMRIFVMVDRFLRLGEAFVKPGSSERHLPLQYPTSRAVTSTLRTVAFDFFKGVHVENLRLLQESLGADSWQRLPVSASYRVIFFDKLLPSPLKPPRQARDGATASSNPFKGFTPGSDWPRPPLPRTLHPSEIDERINQLQENDRPFADKSPVVSNVSKQAGSVASQYWAFITYMPLLAFEVVVAIQHVLDLYIVGVASLLIPTEDMNRLLTTYIPDEAFVCGRKLQVCHRSFLLQRGRSRFREFILKQRASLVQSRVSPLGELARALASYQATPLPVLDSPGGLHGLSEIVVGAESCRSLLASLKSAMLPRPSAASDLDDADTGSQLFVLLSQQQQKSIRDFISDREVVVEQMVDFMYSSVAAHLGSFDFLLKQMKTVRDDADFSRVATEWTTRLREVTLRASYAGGGGIPTQSLCSVWSRCEESFWRVAVDLVSSRHVTPVVAGVETLYDRFRDVTASWLTRETTPDRDTPLKMRLKTRPVIQRSHFDAYVDARDMEIAEQVRWCKAQADYNIVHLLALVNQSGADSAEKAQARDELELWYGELLKIA